MTTWFLLHFFWFCPFDLFSTVLHRFYILFPFYTCRAFEDVNRTCIERTKSNAENCYNENFGWTAPLNYESINHIQASKQRCWMQLYCCQMKKTKDHWLPQCVLLPSQASVGLTLVGSSSSWQHPDTVMWFMAGSESGEQMTTQLRPVAALSATHQEVDNAQTIRPLLIQCHKPPQRRVQPLRWTLPEE